MANQDAIAYLTEKLNVSESLLAGMLETTHQGLRDTAYFRATRLKSAVSDLLANGVPQRLLINALQDDGDDGQGPYFGSLLMLVNNHGSARQILASLQCAVTRFHSS